MLHPWKSMIETQGYRIPLKPASGKVPWGSNSLVLNDLIVIALQNQGRDGDSLQIVGLVGF